MASKPKTAKDGNAPGGPEFEGEAQASGGDAFLGGQVQAETQTREDDGHRTLANPVRDPGPVLPEGEEFKHPDTRKGETLASVNKHHDIVQRTSTSPDWASRDNIGTTKMLPEVRGVLHTSDIYNKEKGEGLTDMAVKKSGDARQLSPATKGEPIDAPADKMPEQEPGKEPDAE